MKSYWISPSKHEVPKPFRGRTEICGMGAKAAQQLARKINQTDFDRAVFFGTAGALKEGVQSGEVFVIDKLCLPGREISLEVPSWAPNLARNSLTTAPYVLKSSSEKESCFRGANDD